MERKFLEGKQTKRYSMFFLWKGNVLILYGDVLVLSLSQESLAQVPDEDADKSPVVVGARYSYTSLVSNQHKASNSSSLSPRLPSHYAVSNGKPLFSISSGNNSNSSFGSVGNSPGPRADRTALSSTSSKKRSQHKGHMSSSTHHKSFNAFLEDTNDEWDDSVVSWTTSSSGQPLTKPNIHTKKTVKISVTPNVSPASEPHQERTTTKVEPKGVETSQQPITSIQQQNRRSTKGKVTVEDVREILKGKMERLWIRLTDRDNLDLWCRSDLYPESDRPWAGIRSYQNKENERYIRECQCGSR